jgi:hypothetical protein
MPGKRRSMADLLAEQRAIEDGPAEAPALTVVPEHAPPAVPAAITAAAIPEPHSPAGHGQLSPAEESSLATCEAAVNNLRLAFAAAGKALAVIQSARLYRGEYGTFEEYVETRWDMSRAQAYRLIEAWRLADRLSPMGDKINERQVRELLPLAGRHGQDAAATVYQVVQDADSVRVTAAVLHDVVALLPADYWDPDEAVRQIRDYLAGDRTPPTPPAADPVRRFSQADKTMSKLEQVVATSGVLEAVRAADPELVSRMAARMRAVADQLERGPSA